LQSLCHLTLPLLLQVAGSTSPADDDAASILSALGVPGRHLPAAFVAAAASLAAALPGGDWPTSREAASASRTQAALLSRGWSAVASDNLSHFVGN
jgi:hypothetical protein